MTAPSRLIVVGDLITDVVAVLAGPLATGSDTPATIQVCGGGQAANTAAWIAAQKVPVTLVGAVGDDGAAGDRVAELERAGAWVFVAGLRPASSATVVRAVGGEVSMTDGPYAETKEQMGGFWVIEVPDLDAAHEWGRKAAAACEGPVEVRPFQGE